MSEASPKASAGRMSGEDLYEKHMATNFHGARRMIEALVPAMEEHLWFVRALKARDAAEVAARLTHHIESAHRRVLGLPRVK